MKIAFIWLFIAANLVSCGLQLYLHNFSTAVLNLFAAIYIYWLTRAP